MLQCLHDFSSTPACAHTHARTHAPSQHCTYLRAALVLGREARVCLLQVCVGLGRPSLGLRVRISRMGEQCPLAAAVSITTNACHILVSEMNFTGPYLPVTPFCPLILSLFLSL